VETVSYAEVPRQDAPSRVSGIAGEKCVMMLQLTGTPVDLYLNGVRKSTGLIAKHYALFIPAETRATEFEIVIKKFGSSQTITRATVTNLYPGKTVKLDMRSAGSVSKGYVSGPLPALLPTLSGESAVEGENSSFPSLFPELPPIVTGKN
jgi:hypothetical protein